MNKKVSLRNPMAILASVTVAISSVFISVSAPISANAAATWTQQTSAGTLAWNSIASSADGTKLAAVAMWDRNYIPRGIFTSSDSGATWTEQTSAGNACWHGIASSADGTKLVAVQQYDFSFGAGSIFTSTDSGATWTERTSAGKALWQSVASSADGTHLVAISNQTSGFAPGNIFTSADSGVSWTLQTGAPNSLWSSVTSSDDGTKLAATQDGGRIFTSTDSGVNWTEQMNAGRGNWASITSSADGSKLLAADAGRGQIWRSTDGGANWIDLSGNISGFWYWHAVASSDDGNTLAISADYDGGYGPGAIFTSVDGGASWTQETGAGIANWSALSMNSDGSKIAATSSASGASSGSIWTNYGAGAPATAPAFSASTPSIPNTYVGSFSAVQTETVTNTGNGDLVFGAGAVTVTGANPGDFTIVADNCSNQTVAPAATCTVTYKFKSAVAGTRTANLVFASNAASSTDTVALSAVAMGVVTIRKIDDSSGSTRGGTTVEITGTGFNSAATVTIGGVNATVTKRKGSTSITVRTPARATTGKVQVVVTNPDTGNASYNGFTYKR